MLHRRILAAFAVIILLVTAIGLFTLRATTRTSQDLDRLIGHTAPTLHALSHLKAAAARLVLEAERYAADGEVIHAVGLENAQSSFEEALAEYVVTAAPDGNSTHLTHHIADSGSSLLSQTGALLQSDDGADLLQTEDRLTAFRDNEQALSGYLEEAISLESGELQQGDASIGELARSTNVSIVLATGGALILALAFGGLLSRQATIDAEVQAQLKVAKGELEKEVAARTDSLEQAKHALEQELEQRRRVEKALRTSETAYRTLAENLPGAVYRLVLGKEHRIQFFNKAATAITGYRDDELSENGICPLIKLARPDEQSRLAATVEEAINTGQPFSVEYHLLHRDGDERILLEQGTPLYDGDGKPFCVDGVIFDITDQVRTEVALEQSEERFRVAAEEALVGIYIIQDDKFRYVNPTMAHYLGYEPQELTDTVSPLELVHPADRYGVAARMQQRLAGIPASAPHLLRGLHREGMEIILESVSRSVLLQDRPAIIGTIRDITQQQQTALDIAQRNRELQALLSISQRLAGEFELQERLQTITGAIVQTIETADAASLWLYDDSGQQLTVRSWSGYAEEEIAALRAPTAEGLARLVSEAGQPRLVTARSLRKSPSREGEAGKRAVLGVPILLEGSLLGTLLVDAFAVERAFDPHDMHLLQAMAAEAAVAIRSAQLLETTQRHRKELQQLSQQLLTAREAEAKRISQELHDVMGQALTAISIDLAEVERILPPEDYAEAHARLQEAEMLTAETLNQTRELSLELRPSMLDDLGLLPTLRWYLHHFGKRLGIQASLSVEGVAGRMAPEVETILYRVVQEGLTNIARHAEASAVEVSLRGHGRQLTLSIKDNGVGFDPTLLSHATSAPHLGLLGMRERVALLGGTVRVESAPGRGVRLLIQLPWLTQAPSMEVEQTENQI